MSGKLYDMLVYICPLGARDLLERNSSSALIVWYVIIVLIEAGLHAYHPIWSISYLRCPPLLTCHDLIIKAVARISRDSLQPHGDLEGAEDHVPSISLCV